MFRAQPNTVKVRGKRLREEEDELNECAKTFLRQLSVFAAAHGMHQYHENEEKEDEDGSDSDEEKEEKEKDDDEEDDSAEDSGEEKTRRKKRKKDKQRTDFFKNEPPNFKFSSSSDIVDTLQLLLRALNKQRMERNAMPSHSSSSSSAPTRQEGFSNDFCVSGSCSSLQLDVLAVPGLSLSGIGSVSLPLLNDTAQQKAAVQSIVSAAQLAPFGLGTQTVQDLSVRHVFKFDADKATIQNPNFQAALNKLVTHCCTAMGCLDAKGKAEGLIDVQLYNVLVYLPGCHFKSHRDTEKLPGMFGTLIVTLPCSFKGGEIVLRQHGKEHIADFGANDNSSVYTSHYLAFYADVEHEVKPLESGVRIALVYNLAWKKPRTHVNALATQNDGIPNLLESLLYSSSFTKSSCLSNQKNSSSIGFVCFTLAHLYTDASLSRSGIGAMKGADGWLAAALQQALAMQSALQASQLYVGYLQRKFVEDGDADDSDFEAMEEDEFKHNEYQFELYESNGQKVDAETAEELQNGFNPLYAINLHKNTIGRTKWNYDKEEIEVTGNEGAKRETLYHVSVLLVVPPIIKLVASIRKDPQKYLPSLRQLISETANANTDHMALEPSASVSAGSAAGSTTSSSACSSSLNELSALRALGVGADAILYRVFANTCGPPEWLLSNADTFSELLHAFGDTSIFLKILRESSSKLNDAPGNGDILERMYGRFVECVRESDADNKSLTAAIKIFLESQVDRSYRVAKNIPIYAPLLLHFLKAVFNNLKKSRTCDSSTLTSVVSLRLASASSSASTCHPDAASVVSGKSITSSSNAFNLMTLVMCEAFCLSALFQPNDNHLQSSFLYSSCELFVPEYLTLVVLMHSLAEQMQMAKSIDDKQKESQSESENSIDLKEQQRLWKLVSNLTARELQRVDTYWTFRQSDVKEVELFSKSMHHTASKWFPMDFTGFASNWVKSKLKPRLEGSVAGPVQGYEAHLKQRVAADSFARPFAVHENPEVQSFLRSGQMQLRKSCDGIAAARKLKLAVYLHGLTSTIDGKGKSAAVTMVKTPAFKLATQNEYDLMQYDVRHTRDVVKQLNLDVLFSDL